MTDIEIARNTKLEKIVDVAKKYNIDEEDYDLYTVCLPSVVVTAMPAKE